MAFEHGTALGVDHRALLVHDVVVLEHVLAGLVVVRFYLLLRALDARGEDARFDRRVIVDVEALHDAADTLAAEDAHQLIVKRGIEARRPLVALTSGTPAQLVIDASRLVALGADDVQAA